MIAVPYYVSPEEYLDIERQSLVRHEYRCGLVYAIAGGSDNHDRLTFNFLKLIDNHFGDPAQCRFYSGNVKVNYQDEFYYYPDAFVTCDPRDRDDRYVKRYPELIAEVLSSSTQTFDLGKKFDDYRQLESLEEYVLIAQESQSVECHRRTSTNIWETIAYKAGELVILKSINLKFPISELYRGLDAQD
ncbi:MAG: Uma2 family endonuclease [Leptolyngbyaceae cyanobacterium SM1_1_3]|nr:Uma2 family endonuclease [Leptolyngbyaceae cyanobacterium SM1_1_3]NJM85330.1 Uma2 family endonuclease [Leptolyngbyaceae cyanobacterium RM2_2_21]NJN02516.1 Uma2 family endonuclease [Leptolyngbyaceae cyanobacterium RM1_1_2]NJO11074.1 Uma2 family endonuclease [Leptolyngbyaceae cyanobacterium SL_1_1]